MITVERWIDIDGEEFKRSEDYKRTKTFTLDCIRLGVVVPDKDGYLYFFDNKKQENIPSHIDLDGKKVGLRYSKKAVN